jgi:hypothetical protein
MRPAARAKRGFDPVSLRPTGQAVARSIHTAARCVVARVNIAKVDVARVAVASPGSARSQPSPDRWPRRPDRRSRATSARVLSRIADVQTHRLFLASRRHSSAVEQLFRKSPPVCAVLQAWRVDTNGHTYQLFVSRGSPSRVDAAARQGPNRPGTPEHRPVPSELATEGRQVRSGRRRGQAVDRVGCHRGP